MGRLKREEPLRCDCGYETMRSYNFATHQKSCRVVVQQKQDQNHLMVLQEKDRVINEQSHALAASERALAQSQEKVKEQGDMIEFLKEQLAQSLKEPRVTNVTNNTTNNNTDNSTHNSTHRYTVSATVNCFGQEDTSHITAEQYKRLLSEPDTAIPRLIKLVHGHSSNANLRLPNKRERRYEIVTQEEGGAKRWKSVDKQVLEDLWESNDLILQRECDEDDGSLGSRYVRFTDKVKDSMDGSDNKKLYQNQLSAIHLVLADEFR